ncbi:WD40 domain-containing protein [candidate division KSB1 bacterium]|nr:WD40 domain-containing protein [candidate division KSB1 bacterium]
MLSSENPADDPLVDISHESLIRQWEILTYWVDKEAESAKIYRRLAETAELHIAGKAGLYQEVDLQVALDWKKKQKPTIAWAKRYPGNALPAYKFLEDSKNFAEAERKNLEQQRLERERLLREQAELMEREARQQRQRLRQARLFAGGLVVLLLIAVVASWKAMERSKEAERQTLTARYNLVRAQDEKAMRTFKDVQYIKGSYREAWFYALAALQQETPQDSLALLPASSGALFDPATINNAFAEEWFSPAAGAHQGAVTSVAFSPDGNMLASASDDRTIR